MNETPPTMNQVPARGPDGRYAKGLARLILVLFTAIGASSACGRSDLALKLVPQDLLGFVVGAVAGGCMILFSLTGLGKFDFDSFRRAFVGAPIGALTGSIATGLIWNALWVALGLGEVRTTLLQRLLPSVSLDVAIAGQLLLGIPLEAALLLVLGYLALRV